MVTLALDELRRALGHRWAGIEDLGGAVDEDGERDGIADDVDADHFLLVILDFQPGMLGDIGGLKHVVRAEHL